MQIADLSMTLKSKGASGPCSRLHRDISNDIARLRLILDLDLGARGTQPGTRSSFWFLCTTVDSENGRKMHIQGYYNSSESRGWAAQ